MRIYSFIELFKNKNVLIFVCLYIIAFILYLNNYNNFLKNKKLYFLIPILFFIIAEIINYTTGLDFFDSIERNKILL